MKNVILILFSILIFASCEKDSTELINLDQTIIGSGDLHGNGREDINKSNLVINSTSDWDKLLDKIDAVNNESQHFSETQIDFAAFTILAVFDEIKGTGGHYIKIDKVVQKNNSIEVTILKSEPRDYGYAVMTQPFYITKIEKTNKNVVFKE